MDSCVCVYLQFGITSVEPSGGFLRGDDPLEQVELLGIASGWSYTDRVEHYTENCNGLVGSSINGFPDIHGIASALEA